MTNQLREGNAGKIIDIGPPKYSSREAKGVWERPDKKTALWKIYSNDKSFKNAFDTITTTDHEGLPVASPFSAVRGYQFRESPAAHWTAVYILETTALTGTFFAMSQAGKKHVWKQWLNGLDLQRDSQVLDRALTATKAAVRLRVQDPQGFLEKTRHEPVAFIDVHVGTASGAADEMLQQIKDRMGIKS